MSLFGASLSCGGRLGGRDGEWHLIVMLLLKSPFGDLDPAMSKILRFLDILGFRSLNFVFGCSKHVHRDDRNILHNFKPKNIIELLLTAEISSFVYRKTFGHFPFRSPGRNPETQTNNYYTK